MPLIRSFARPQRPAVLQSGKLRLLPAVLLAAVLVAAAGGGAWWWKQRQDAASAAGKKPVARTGSAKPAPKAAAKPKANTRR